MAAGGRARKMATFGARSTGTDVLRGVDLSGKSAIVTGGTSGLGLETVRLLAAAGARVILTSRSAAAGQTVADNLTAVGLKGSINVQEMELSDLASVRTAAAALDEHCKVVDFLILNAGVAASPLSYTKDGFESQFGINHVAQSVLTLALLPKLQRQGCPSRIVVVASKAQTFQRGKMRFDDLHFRRRRYSKWQSYSQSKTANILFAKELAARLEGTQISVFSLHPGSIWTGVTRHYAPQGGWLAWLLQLVMRLPIPEFKTLQQGVATQIYAAVSPELEGKSGAYIENCAIAQPSKTARNLEQACQLWAVTEEQVAAAAAPGGFKP